jgi:hypothetical protein
MGMDLATNPNVDSSAWTNTRGGHGRSNRSRDLFHAQGECWGRLYRKPLGSLRSRALSPSMKAYSASASQNLRDTPSSLLSRRVAQAEPEIAEQVSSAHPHDVVAPPSRCERYSDCAPSRRNRSEGGSAVRKSPTPQSPRRLERCSQPEKYWN